MADDYFSNQCGFVSAYGDECGYWATEGAPVNLCIEHLMEAYTFVKANLETITPRRNTGEYACKQCFSRAVFFIGIRDELECDTCGARGTRKDFVPTRKPYSALFAAGKPKPEPVVYYISHGNRIKIGTSHDWRARLLAIPHDKVLALEPGTFVQERQRHDQFHPWRVGNTEWFEQNDELWDHIVRLNVKHSEFQEEIDAHNRRKRRGVRPPAA